MMGMMITITITIRTKPDLAALGACGAQGGEFD
jgi:hypothetical protein